MATLTVACPDPFDPANLKVAEPLSMVTAKRLLLTLPVRRPGKEAFVRVHPDPAYRLETNLIELKESGKSKDSFRAEYHLVDPSLWADLTNEVCFGPRLLTLAVTRQNDLFLWVSRLVGRDGGQDGWITSDLEAIAKAEKQWVRVTPGSEGYDVIPGTGITAEPQFPDMPFADMLRVAFKDKYIASWDHPVLQRLRGEV